ncbi:MAG: DNA-binding protein [Phycisphaerales bacterium]|nr:DNA-binding protein [Phycisphaerales bacterium]
MKTQSRRHELFISAEVIAELSRPSYRQSREALAFATGPGFLELTDEVLGLAQLLIDEKAMPGPLEGDAVHVAAATFYRMDYLMTWNVKHLANPNKRLHLTTVCLRVGLAPPAIITPINLWETDNE